MNMEEKEFVPSPPSRPGYSVSLQHLQSVEDELKRTKLKVQTLQKQLNMRTHHDHPYVCKTPLSLLSFASQGRSAHTIPIAKICEIIDQELSIKDQCDMLRDKNESFIDEQLNKINQFRTDPKTSSKKH
eukprot:330129_1